MRTPLLIRWFVRGLSAAALLSLLACGPSRAPVPPGEIPSPTFVSEEDENYGHEVLSELSDKYPLDTNDARINRVRDIVDRLTDDGRGGINRAGGSMP